MKLFKIFLLLSFLILITCSSYLYAQEDLEQKFSEGKDALAQSNYQKAIDIFEEVALEKMDNSKYEVYYYMGLTYQKWGQFDYAMKKYREVVAVLSDDDPYEILSFVGLAECDEKLNKEQDCFNHYKEALMRVSGYEDIQNIITGRVTQTKIDTYEELLSFHPDDPWIQKRLIRLYQDKSKFTEGVVLFKKIFKNKTFF